MFTFVTVIYVEFDGDINQFMVHACTLASTQDRIFFINSPLGTKTRRRSNEGVEVGPLS